MLLELHARRPEGAIPLADLERECARAASCERRGIDFEVTLSPGTVARVLPALARRDDGSVDKGLAASIDITGEVRGEKGVEGLLELAFSLGHALGLAVHADRDSPPCAREDLLERARLALAHETSERTRKIIGIVWGLVLALFGVASLPLLAHFAFPIIAFGIATMAGAMAGFPIDLRTFREMRRGR